MRFLKTHILLLVMFWASGAQGATIILNSGFLGHINSKKTTVVTDRNERIVAQPENKFYMGGVGGLDVPFQPNSFGLISTLGLVFGSQQIAVNQYNIENYEYSIKQADGVERNTIKSKGNLEDFNLQEKVGRYMRENPGDYLTEASDLILISSLLFRYATPVSIPAKGRAWEITSKVLGIANPYIAGGFTMITITRKVELNQEILEAITKEHGTSILRDGEEIVGKDPAPDLDFYLSFGGGFNIAVPQAKLFGTQTTLTLEFLYHISISPDDQQKPYDDAYIISQNGMSFRIASGIAL